MRIIITACTALLAIGISLPTFAVHRNIHYSIYLPGDNVCGNLDLKVRRSDHRYNRHRLNTAISQAKAIREYNVYNCSEKTGKAIQGTIFPKSWGEIAL